MKPRVLNVNDHAANRYMVTRMLERAGYEVVAVENGREAIEACLAAETRPAVVVLDVRLPDMSGFEVCRHLKTREDTRDIKILHTSATLVTTDNRIAGLEAGADGYLTQPFEPQELIAIVRSLVRLRETEHDLQVRNERLLDEDRRKDEFLAMLAHELRNPLAAIQLGLPILAEGQRTPLEARTVEILQRQTTLLTRLVDDLLDVSRVTRGRIELQREPLDLRQLVESAAEVMRTRVLQPRRQVLVVEVPATPVIVAGDANRLEQVLTNLIDNASKYSDPDTRIHVRLVAGADVAQLSVKDQGIGIDGAVLPHVFDLFAQARTSLARSRGGLGIGLTLVKALVELHGGSIVAESRGLGHGTELRVRLPLSAQAPVEHALEPVPAGGEALRVLLVDDNDDARALLRALCETQGHTVAEAADGLGGVEQALAFRPHVAFVDIGLPGFDGYEVARRIRTQAWRPRLIALTGYGSTEHQRLATEAGFDEHVVKPIQLARLQRILGGVRP